MKLYKLENNAIYAFDLYYVSAAFGNYMYSISEDYLVEIDSVEYFRHFKGKQDSRFL